MRWILFGLGLLFLALGAERVWRLRQQPAPVTKSSINAVLFSVGLAGPAYSFVTAGSALYPFTQALWHLMVCVLIGELLRGSSSNPRLSLRSSWLHRLMLCDGTSLPRGSSTFPTMTQRRSSTSWSSRRT